MKYCRSKFINSYNIFCPYFPNIKIQLGIVSSFPYSLSYVPDDSPINTIHIGSSIHINPEHLGLLEEIRNNLRIYHDQS